MGRLLRRFNTQPPEGDWQYMDGIKYNDWRVSTHSRPKATGSSEGTENNRWKSFNTQPPEGDCPANQLSGLPLLFQHTAARRRLVLDSHSTQFVIVVSTHSRPKATVTKYAPCNQPTVVSTHSRPKATGGSITKSINAFRVSTHSRPKATVDIINTINAKLAVSTHSRPKATDRRRHYHRSVRKFQHTAARRRL